ncbi:hypothetical protein U2057_15345, partial [Listeria monocytogenes]|uniref:hypothetical protein n=1 Tax=Listeria monocytogenes TaxID=1639 RepID=UPI002FDC48AC
MCVQLSAGHHNQGRTKRTNGIVLRHQNDQTRMGATGLPMPDGLRQTGEPPFYDRPCNAVHWLKAR